MKCFLLFFFFCLASYAQTGYPQDYFTSPVDIPIVLSGTFGELRSGHFHAGIDIKTQQRTGLKIYASAEGYVGRIKISHFGYGKAIYITHPNGYTSVYGHLKKFSERIENYIKECQYKDETFEVEVFLTPDELSISSKELIAFSGNTGGSGGPHLHFEIRDNQERPLNPMLFGIGTKDTRPPLVLAAYAYTQDQDAHINGKTGRVRLRLIPKKNGAFEAEQIKAYGKIGFGVVSYDRQDYAPNKNGVNKIQSFFNGNKSLEVDFKRFSFDETKHIKRYIDYEFFKTNKSRIQKLFIEENNPLSLFKDPYDNGFVKIEDSTSSVYKIRILDFKGNETWVNIPIDGRKIQIDNAPYKTNVEHHLLKADETTILESGKASVTFYKNTLYENKFVKFKVNSDTLFIGKDVIPLQKNFYINYDISHYKPEDRSRLYVARFYGKYKKPYYVGGRRKGDSLSASTKTLGTFALALDTIAPKIRPLNFEDKKWLSKYRYLKLKIEDEQSGISKYRATVNGKWILMEYDYKTNTLIHDFNDNIVTDTKNELKLIVTDNVGNSSTFEATFFRK